MVGQPSLKRPIAGSIPAWGTRWRFLIPVKDLRLGP